MVLWRSLHWLLIKQHIAYKVATWATTVSLRTCRWLPTAADTEVAREGPAGRGVQNQDNDRVTCLQWHHMYETPFDHSRVLSHPLRYSEVVSRHSCSALPTIIINNLSPSAPLTLHRNKPALRKCSETNGAWRIQNKCYLLWFEYWIAFIWFVLIGLIKYLTSEVQWLRHWLLVKGSRIRFPGSPAANTFRD